MLNKKLYFTPEIEINSFNRDLEFDMMVSGGEMVSNDAFGDWM